MRVAFKNLKRCYKELIGGLIPARGLERESVISRRVNRGLSILTSRGSYLDSTVRRILRNRVPTKSHKEASCWTDMADKDDVLLNSREVAFLLDLSPDTVNEFARRNIIPAFKKGRQWRFRKRDITSVKRQLRGINAAA